MTIKKLVDILGSYPHSLVQGSAETDVRDLHLDSRQVKPGDLFIAVKGAAADGHAYIEKAIGLGAVAVVCQQLPEVLHPGVAYVQTPDTAKAAGHLASAFFGHPSRQLHLVAITGTNGKTSTVTLQQQLFRALGYRVGVLSTIENKIDDEVIPTNLTTPDAITINRLLALMLERGCTHCFMEASSHAIVQERIAGLDFDGAIFSNITHDHLDYHGTFEAYIAAKKKLFDELPASAFALVNADDRRGMVMLQNCKARHYTFALKSPANFKGLLKANTFDGLLMEVDGREAWFRLIGDFNAYNLLGVYGSAVLLGEDPEQVLEALSALRPARGRFEQLHSPQGLRAVVDYAHTPDALENVLKTIQNIRRPGERILTVVGCGGDRDKSKRPVMAKTAALLSDQLIITADNPRSEDPLDIIAQMVAGLSEQEQATAQVVPDRREALVLAVRMALPGDIILVAGKGHETYQDIKGVKYPFDDKAILAELLAQR